ncbi:MAG: hypothetical protein K0Q81_417 [Paenibacillus sp.]|nr:hypothetical protein [Paenibacillus sp.]
MDKGLRILVSICSLIAFSIALASTPILIKAEAGQLTLEWSAAGRAIYDYFQGLGSGQSFLFLTGKTEHAFFEQIGGYALVSFGYSAAAALSGITLGLLAGMGLSRIRRNWIKQAFELLSIIPDFLLILWLQLLVVVIYKRTGLSIAKVASLSVDDPAILLPLLSMTLIPLLYMMRSISVHTHQVLTEDYVLNAKAKGLSKLYTYTYHVLPNVLPYLKAELHKLTGIIVGNLFIMEYLFNLRGMTKLLLSSSYSSTNLKAGLLKGYQFPLTVNCFMAFMLLYLCLYGLMRGYVWLIERKFAHE